MGRVLRREIRKRGFFRWLFLIIFWIFNLFMAAWLFTYLATLSGMQTNDQFEHAGAVIGGTIDKGVLVFFWVAGAVILGLFVLLTRGQKTLVLDE